MELVSFAILLLTYFVKGYFATSYYCFKYYSRFECSVDKIGNMYAHFSIPSVNSNATILLQYIKNENNNTRKTIVCKKRLTPGDPTMQVECNVWKADCEEDNLNSLDTYVIDLFSKEYVVTTGSTLTTSKTMDPPTQKITTTSTQTTRTTMKPIKYNKISTTKLPQNIVKSNSSLKSSILPPTKTLPSNVTVVIRKLNNEEYHFQPYFYDCNCRNYYQIHNFNFTHIRNRNYKFYWVVPCWIQFENSNYALTTTCTSENCKETNINRSKRDTTEKINRRYGITKENRRELASIFKKRGKRATNTLTREYLFKRYGCNPCSYSLLDGLKECSKYTICLIIDRHNQSKQCVELETECTIRSKVIANTNTGLKIELSATIGLISLLVLTIIFLLGILMKQKCKKQTNSGTESSEMMIQRHRNSRTVLTENHVEGIYVEIN